MISLIRFVITVGWKIWSYQFNHIVERAAHYYEHLSTKVKEPLCKSNFKTLSSCFTCSDHKFELEE